MVHARSWSRYRCLVVTSLGSDRAADMWVANVSAVPERKRSAVNLADRRSHYQPHSAFPDFSVALYALADSFWQAAGSPVALKIAVASTAEVPRMRRHAIAPPLSSAPVRNSYDQWQMLQRYCRPHRHWSMVRPAASRVVIYFRCYQNYYCENIVDYPQSRVAGLAIARGSTRAEHYIWEHIA